MEKETRHAPKSLRYPLFLAGLIVLVGGGVAGEMLRFATDSFVAVASIGFILLMLSVLIR